MLNIPVSMSESVILKWEMFDTIKNLHWTHTLWHISKWITQKILRKVKVNSMVTWKEIQDDIRPIGMLVTKRSISNKLHMNGFKIPYAMKLIFIDKQELGFLDEVHVW